MLAKLKALKRILYVCSTLAVFTACGDKGKTTTDPGMQPPSRLSKSPSPEERIDSTPDDPESPVLLNAPLTNVEEISHGLGLTTLHQRNFRGQGLKVAILDNGFAGLTAALGTRLPKDTVLDTGIGNPPQATEHGTKMAEIAWATATGQSSWTPLSQGPEILLFNANGFTNFSYAVDAAIAAKANIIVYSQVWEYGGNGDGDGFINEIVGRAVKAGILWLNAAGNNGKSTWTGGIEHRGSQVTLPYGDKYVRLKVVHPSTPVKIVLSWSDFRNDPGHRTRFDFDLILEDCRGSEIGSGRLIQDGDSHSDGTYSAHAREIIRTSLDPGVYCLRIVAQSPTYPAHMRLRLTADGRDVELIDRSSDHQLLIPADNPSVLAIGASDVDYTATSGTNLSNEKEKLIFGYGKPNLLLLSRVQFGQLAEFKGTSAATAIAAGALAAWISQTGLRPDAPAIASFITAGQLTQTPGRWIEIEASVRWQGPLLYLGNAP